MTRINCVPPKELHNKHLVAEYYELPRVFDAVRKLLAKGIDPASLPAPDDYVLGDGHVKFFYTKLKWLANRQAEIAVEMKARGMKLNPNNIKGLLVGLPEHLLGDYVPTDKALAANRERISSRLIAMLEKKTAKQAGKPETGLPP